MSKWLYAHFADDAGLNRAAVDHALDLLVEQGRVELTATPEGVGVKPIPKVAV